MMQSYMGVLLHRGARPIGQVKRGIDIHEAISPIQMPGLIPSACYPWTTDLPFGIYPGSRAEESQDKPGESGENLTLVQNQSNQALSEHKLNTPSGQNQSESGSGLTPLPKSVEVIQLKPNSMADNLPVTTKSNLSVITQSNLSVITQSNLSGPTQSNLPVTAQSRSDKAGKHDVGPIPQVDFLPRIGKGVDSFPQGKGKSIPESVPSIEGAKGRVENAEKVIHFSKPLDLTQSFIKTQVHKSQALIHEVSSHPTRKGSDRVSIASVPHQSYQEDQGSKTHVSQLSPANKGLAAPLARPSESARNAQGFQEILYPQGKKIPLPGSIINQTLSHPPENIHKLIINRLNIQVINQKPAVPSQQAPQVQMPSVSPDSGEVLDRYYLKHFF